MVVDYKNGCRNTFFAFARAIDTDKFVAGMLPKAVRRALAPHTTKAQTWQGFQTGMPLTARSRVAAGVLRCRRRRAFPRAISHQRDIIPTSACQVVGRHGGSIGGAGSHYGYACHGTCHPIQIPMHCQPAKDFDRGSRQCNGMYGFNAWVDSIRRVRTYTIRTYVVRTYLLRRKTHAHSMYLGAACHPWKRVTGVANGLRR